MSQRDCRVNIHSWPTTISNTSNSTSMANKTIYDFSAETLDGQLVPLSSYRGKVLLITNVATFWGSTIEEVNILPPLINYSQLTSSKCLLLYSDCFLISGILFCVLISQYHRLNALIEMFGDLNFTILGFPCNQFGLQSPGSYLHLWQIITCIITLAGCFILKIPILDICDEVLCTTYICILRYIYMSVLSASVHFSHFIL